MLSVVSMDGFHLSNRVLHALGRSERKGAPDTFDIGGFASLLHRIKGETENSIYYPIFDRNIEESISAQGKVLPSAKLVVVEGNYLCYDQDGWEAIKTILDETWYLQADEEIRMKRLIARHLLFGKSPEAAEAWARGTDEQNARLIGDTASSADFTILLD